MLAKKLCQFVFLAFLAIVFFIPGCAEEAHLGMYQYTHLVNAGDHPQVFPVYVDKEFGEADKLDIVNALDQWNYVFNGHARFVVVDFQFDMQPEVILDCMKNNGFLIMKITASNPLTQTADDVVGTEHNGTPHGVSLGFTPQLSSHKVYIVRDRLQNGDVFFILMHELGHALGADHTSDGLMYPHYSKVRFQCVDQSAAVQVAKAQGWSTDSLNYCLISQDVKGKVMEAPSSTEDQQRLDPAVDGVRRQMLGNELKVGD